MNMQERMTVAKALRKAAVYIDGGKRDEAGMPGAGLCATLDYALYTILHEQPTYDTVRELISPCSPWNKTADDGYWWGDPVVCSDKQHNARVLGALFLAEMYERGDLP